MSLKTHGFAVFVTLFYSSSVTAGTSLEQFFMEQQERSSFGRIFFDSKIESPTRPGPRVFLVSGSLDEAFDFRPDAVVVPTNTQADLFAEFPITQHILIDRAQLTPGAADALRQAVDARRKGLLPLGTGSLTVTLPEPARQRLPGVVCLIATDYSQGGSNERRDLFYQHHIATGVGGCLRDIDATGARSIALPLVGSATFATRDSALKGEERDLLQCRLINSISGIGQAIAEFSHTPFGLTDVGVVIWEKDLRRLFGTTPADPRRKEFDRFAAFARASILRGLAGKNTTSAELGMPQCLSIFGL
jgi:hypothetical protein